MSYGPTKYGFARGSIAVVHWLLGAAAVCSVPPSYGLSLLAIPVLIASYQFAVVIFDIGDNTRALVREARSIGDLLERHHPSLVQDRASAVASPVEPLTADDLEHALRQIWRDRGDPKLIAATWDGLRRQVDRGVVDQDRIRAVIRRLFTEGILREAHLDPLEKMLGLA